MSNHVRRSVVPLAELSPGTPFRLFSRYRDKSPRPRFKVGRNFLCQHELEVIEHVGDVTLVKCNNTVVTLWSGMRIAL
jgi:hypothetical protein